MHAPHLGLPRWVLDGKRRLRLVRRGRHNEPRWNHRVVSLRLRRGILERPNREHGVRRVRRGRHLERDCTCWINHGIGVHLCRGVLERPNREHDVRLVRRGRHLEPRRNHRVVSLRLRRRALERPDRREHDVRRVRCVKVRPTRAGSNLRGDGVHRYIRNVRERNVRRIAYRRRHDRVRRLPVVGRRRDPRWLNALRRHATRGVGPSRGKELRRGVHCGPPRERNGVPRVADEQSERRGGV